MFEVVASATTASSRVIVIVAFVATDVKVHDLPFEVSLIAFIAELEVIYFLPSYLQVFQHHILQKLEVVFLIFELVPKVKLY